MLSVELIFISTHTAVYLYIHVYIPSEIMSKSYDIDGARYSTCLVLRLGHSREQCQCHGCQCSGFLRRHINTNHHISFAEKTGRCILWKMFDLLRWLKRFQHKKHLITIVSLYLILVDSYSTFLAYFLDRDRICPYIHIHWFCGIFHKRT